MDCVDKFSQLGADCRWARLEGHSPAAIQHAIGKGVPELGYGFRGGTPLLSSPGVVSTAQGFFVAPSGATTGLRPLLVLRVVAGQAVREALAGRPPPGLRR